MQILIGNDEVIKNLYTLFDAAWEENMNGRGTDITRMVTTFVPDAIQNLQAYEDLGFTPVEIAHMAKFYKDRHSVETIEDNMRTAAKLMEWAKYKDLEAQGRLIVLSKEDIHPCKYCDTGWSSISSEGCKSCHDDCERLKQYNKKYNN